MVSVRGIVLRTGNRSPPRVAGAPPALGLPSTPSAPTRSPTASPAKAGPSDDEPTFPPPLSHASESSGPVRRRRQAGVARHGTDLPAQCPPLGWFVLLAGCGDTWTLSHSVAGFTRIE